MMKEVLAANTPEDAAAGHAAAPAVTGQLQTPAIDAVLECSAARPSWRAAKRFCNILVPGYLQNASASAIMLALQH
jgi:hypothetical protein